jgi:hypothetical protein
VSLAFAQFAAKIAELALFISLQAAHYFRDAAGMFRKDSRN